MSNPNEEVFISGWVVDKYTIALENVSTKYGDFYKCLVLNKEGARLAVGYARSEKRAKKIALLSLAESLSG